MHSSRRCSGTDGNQRCFCKRNEPYVNIAHIAALICSSENFDATSAKFVNRRAMCSTTTSGEATPSSSKSLRLSKSGFSYQWPSVAMSWSKKKLTNSSKVRRDRSKRLGISLVYEANADTDVVTIALKITAGRGL